MKIQTIVMLALATFALASCATAPNAGQADPELQFQKLGAADPALENQIVDRYEKMVEVSEADSEESDGEEDGETVDAPRNPDDVTVLVGTMPEGVSMSSSGGLTVEEGYDHEIVARFGLSPATGNPYDPYDDPDDKALYVERMRMLGAAADVDTLVVNIVSQGEYLMGASGFLMRTDPEVDSDDTEPMPEDGQNPQQGEGGDDWM